MLVGFMSPLVVIGDEVFSLLFPITTLFKKNLSSFLTCVH